MKIYAVFIITLIAFSCTNDVSPYADIENNIVTYCMLDTRAEVNLVRIHKVYYKDIKKTVTGRTRAILSESEGGEYFLEDTLISGKEDYLFYKIPKEIIKRDGYYRLTIINDSVDKRWADCHVPKESGMEVNQVIVPSKENLYINLSFPRASHDVIYYRMMIEYELYGKEKHLVGIPYMLYINPRSKYFVYDKEIWTYRRSELSSEIFTLMHPAGDSLTNLLQIRGDKFIRAYSDTIFWYFMKELSLDYGAENVKIKGGRALFYSIDKEYYNNFYLPVNTLFSVRLDESYLFSNFKGGKNNFGFFGAMAVDTVKYKIPSVIIRKSGVIDDQ